MRQRRRRRPRRPPPATATAAAAVVVAVAATAGALRRRRVRVGIRPGAPRCAGRATRCSRRSTTTSTSATSSPARSSARAARRRAASCLRLCRLRRARPARASARATPRRRGRAGVRPLARGGIQGPFLRRRVRVCRFACPHVPLGLPWLVGWPDETPSLNVSDHCVKKRKEKIYI